MEIKRGQEVVADVYVKSSSYTHEEINGEHIACVDFDSSAALSFSINDSITYMGNPYYIRYKESVTKEETSVGYRYRITFYHALYRLHDVAFFLYDQPDFRKRMSSYTGTALQVLTLVLASLNRVYPGWLLGDVEPTRAQTFNFKDKTCAEVADELTSAYEMEFWVDGRTLYFGKREDSVNARLTLSQGSGFRSITVSAVDETPPVTRLYAYGSDVNITSEQGDYLSLPGGETCIEANTDKYGVIEHVMQFEEVYPHGEFTVTERIDDCTLRASGIDFDLADCLIDDVEVIATFQDGGLAGYDLAIVEGSWNNSTKQFKVKKVAEENALEVPGDIHFAVGDRFILTGLRMPESYYVAAQAELLSEAQAWLSDHCENRVQLQAVCDEVYFAEQNIYLSCGMLLHVAEARLGIDREIRCTSVKRYMENGGDVSFRYEVVLSDFLQGKGFGSMVNDIKGIPDTIKESYNRGREYTRRRWRDVLETLDLMFDPEGDYFTDVISPLVVHTAQLLVGTNSQQMAFKGVHFIPNYQHDANVFSNTAGTLDHFTAGADGAVRTWVIASGVFALSGGNAYYVYARCQRTGDNGSILLSPDRIQVDGDGTYYHFLVGALNTPVDGVRSWQPSFGYTEIAGNQITTGVIKDALSRLVINLIEGTIYGKVTFASGTSGYANIADKPDLSVYDEALNYIDNVLPVDLARLQNQIDDAIESWFYHYDPTLSNIPASGWTTNALKEAHLDDTFTNLDSGQSWRFTRSGPAGSYVYSWALLSDSAATKALVLAGQAKDTADGKRRVFVNTPYPPYDVGDLWAQGAAGDIMRCKTARLTGSYVAADWEKASKYIDESKASALATAAASSGMQIARDDLAKRLGYTDYAAMVTAATQGKTIIDGGYIRTALIDAAAIVTETLVAQRLTAAMIEALDITTSQLTVTSGAKIGNFSIYDGWLTSNSAAGEDVGYLDMRSASSRIAFGSNLLPVSSAGGSLSLTGIIQNINKALSGGVTYALDLRAAGDFDSSVKAVALMANGGLNFRGSCSFVEEVAPLNTNISNSSYSTAESLKWYRNFVFQAPSSGYYADIYLPKDAAVEAAFGYFTTGRAVVDAGVIRIYLICTRWSSGYYRVKSDSSTPIIKHTGDTMDYVQINAGDCCTFTYLNRSWYYSASNWE